MKKLILASALCAAVPAMAASNVTLYGAVDGGVTATKLTGQDATYTMTNGNWLANKFGIAGTEELGNGNAAFFKLEQGFKLNNGQGEGAFRRQAFLGLEGNWGKFAFGRMGALGSDSGDFSLFTGTAYGTSFQPIGSVYSAFIMTDWMDNSIVYETPSMNGWSLIGMYSNGIDSDEMKWSKNDHYYGLGIKNASGPFNMAAYWEMLDNKALGGSANPKATNLFNVQAGYDFGPFTLGAAYQYALHTMTLPNATAFSILKDVNGVPTEVAPTKGANQHALALSVSAPLAGGTAMLQTQGAIGKIKDTGAKYNAFSVGAAYLYPLSKRTTVYADAAYGTTGKAFKDYNSESQLSGWTGTVGMSHAF